MSRQQPLRRARVVRQDLPGQHGGYIQDELVDQGDFLIVQPTKERSPVTAEIHRILSPYQVKHIRDQGMCGAGITEGTSYPGFSSWGCRCHTANYLTAEMADPGTQGVGSIGHMGPFDDSSATGLHTTSG
ncbi:hypothetical protein HPB50_028472 [Hyalomma asiaticum]|nr:hypothetical protein HPB50_028472 [Hyalomma asiaticum]